MAATHGGSRPGAGRKPKSDAPGITAAPLFDDPLAYLVAVATGRAPGDSLRVAAAKAALPFTAPKQRAPVASPEPKTLHSKAERAINSAETAAWAQKAAAIRAKHGK